MRPQNARWTEGLSPTLPDEEKNSTFHNNGPLDLQGRFTHNVLSLVPLALTSYAGKVEIMSQEKAGWKSYSKRHGQ